MKLGPFGSSSDVALDDTAKHLLNSLWWMALVKGLAAVAFGIVAVFWPALTLVVLVYLFSAYILVSGITNIFWGVSSARRGSMWLLIVILGILEVGVGVYAVQHPLISFAALILLIGFSFIFRGIIELVLAFMEIPIDRANRALLTIGGVLAILAGIIVLVQPISGGVAFVWALGVYGIITGAILIARAASAKTMLERELTLA